MSASQRNVTADEPSPDRPTGTRRTRTRLLLYAMFVFAAGCTTSFTGAPFVEGGRPGCERKCASVGLAMAAFVFMGEYSTACICDIPQRAARADRAAAIGASVAGIAAQQRHAEDPFCSLHDCSRFGD